MLDKQMPAMRLFKSTISEQFAVICFQMEILEIEREAVRYLFRVTDNRSIPTNTFGISASFSALYSVIEQNKYDKQHKCKIFRK